jgi:uncharacterized repeat protein (TIGR01451 family)
MTLVLLTVAWLTSPLSPVYAACDIPVFINEIHYDNVGTDVNELIEIAGPAGTDLTGWQLVLYNGGDGQSYGTPIALSGVIDDEERGYGALVFLTPGLQNGAPDGVALVDPSGTVRQFLSYEGTFTATNGPASGRTSQDINVAEDPPAPVGYSLQLTGSGTCATDFTWAGPALASPGTRNNGQSFTTLPTIIQTSPAHDAYDVAVDALLTLTFSEPIQSNGPVSLSCTHSGHRWVDPVAMTGNRLQLPHPPFYGGERCTVTVPAASVTDLDDTPDPLAEDFSWVFDVGYPTAAYATAFISAEEAYSRAVVDTQDDAWRAASQAATSCTTFLTGLLSETQDTLCGARTGDCILPSVLPTGLVISYTLRNMDGRTLGSPDAWASGQGAGCNDMNSTLQDGAPRPTGLPGCYYNDADSFRGANEHPNGVLFTFTEPVRAFGAWFGDLETKPYGTTYYHDGADGGSGIGGAQAYFRLFFDDGSMQEFPIIPTLAPGGPWLSTAVAQPLPLGGGGDVRYCGGPDQATDAAGCGNETTRWIGFVSDPAKPVRQMLVVVGDDDHSGAGPSDGPNVSCAGGDANTCNGGTEYISFIGPTLCAAPDVSLSKQSQPATVRAGGVITYTLLYSNRVPGLAVQEITITDTLPPDATFLTTVAADPPVTLIDNRPRWQIAALPAGVTGRITYRVQIGGTVAGEITNHATISTLGDLQPANNMASATTFVVLPGLAVQKWTNDQAISAAPGPLIAQGAPVAWRYTFTNTGNITLTNLALSDDRIPVLTCAEGDIPAVLPPAGNFTCTVTGQAELGQYQNRATVQGIATVQQHEVISATAESFYYGYAITPPLPTLELRKTVINDHGGTATANDFRAQIDGQPVAWSTPITVSAGLHWASEEALPGYTASGWGGDCAANGQVTLTFGEHKVCTITNDDLAPHLTVQKVVINDNGGQAQVSDFPLFVDGQPVSSGQATELMAGIYQVTERNLPGYNGLFSGDCGVDGQVTLSLGAVKRCVLTNDDFFASLGDRVWYDANENGVQDAGEGGVAGVTVTLLTDTGRVVTTTQTGPDGRYHFARLLPGGYIVVWTPPINHLFTQPSIGGDATLDSDADPFTGRAAIRLDAHATITTLDVGLYEPTPGTVLGALGQRVWHDLNANGRQDPGEPGLAGILVTLVDGAGRVLATTVSDETGAYHFGQLPLGAYQVRVTLPTEYRFTLANQGDSAHDSDVEPTTGSSTWVTLTAETPAQALDAGVLAYPLLQVTKRAGVATVTPSATAATLLTYTIHYRNQGLIDAGGVVITERVPLSTTFHADASSPGWQCADGGVGGALCRFVVGALPAQTAGVVHFAITLPAQSAATLLINTAWLGDDGANTAHSMPTTPRTATAQVQVLGPTALTEDDEPGRNQFPLYLPAIRR